MKQLLNQFDGEYLQAHRVRDEGSATVVGPNTAQGKGWALRCVQKW